MGLDAVLPEAGVICFECSLPQVGHGKAPLAIRCAASDDEATARFSFHAAQPARLYCDRSVFLLRGGKLDLSLLTQFAHGLVQLTLALLLN